MCRLYGFRSSVDSGVHASLVAADNALGRQSTKHPDGWGVAYYQGRYPHVIRSEKKALTDNLFASVSGVVSTRTLVAHVRQATVGSVGILNTHPFQYGPWIFAHNGQIAGFKAGQGGARDALLQMVDGRFRGSLLGSTDSELLFFVIMSRLGRAVPDVLHESVHREQVVDACGQAVASVLEACPESEDDLNMLTFMLSNGSVMVGFRYRKPLNYSTYKTACPESAACPAYDASLCEKRVEDGPVKHLVMSSEIIGQGPNVWDEVPHGQAVSVNHGMHFRQHALVPSPA